MFQFFQNEPKRDLSYAKKKNKTKQNKTKNKKQKKQKQKNLIFNINKNGEVHLWFQWV
jgi:hypothetical protein